MAVSEAIQTISRLTPLADVLLMIDAEVKPVIQRTIDVFAGAGRTLAADAMAPSRPVSSLALQDGWAISADETLGAGGHAPSPLLRVPPRIETGQALPAGSDSDAVIPLRRAGERLRSTDLAAFSAAGIARIQVREPRVRVLPVRGSGIINAAARMVAADIDRRGGAARLDESGRGLDVAMAADTADAIVAIGGTGSGRNDNSVQILAREGQLRVYGLALTPGETSAFGFVGTRPVLLLPGRLDAVVSVWVVVGRRLLDRLAGAKGGENEPGETLSLARKVSSTVGLAEVVPVGRTSSQAEPMAIKYLPLSSLARSDGWILVPADSEGYSAGSPVQVRPWP